MDNRANAIIESFKTYPNPIKHLDRKNFVSKKLYTEILTSFFERLVFFIITTGKEITIPSRLGTFQAIQKLQKKRVNWGKTIKAFGEYNKTAPEGKKKLVYHKEDQYRPYLRWSKKKANFKNKSYYAFNLSRPNFRPNSYNKKNPKVSLMPFFREEGYKFYIIPIRIPTIKEYKEYNASN